MHNPNHPTLLRTPGQYALPNERILPSGASDYTIEEAHQGWLLVAISRGGLMYFGAGPVCVELP